MSRIKNPPYVRLHRMQMGEFTFTVVLMIIYFALTSLIPSFLLQ